MGADQESSKGPALLRFFGLETPAKAMEATLWICPYLIVLCLALSGLSYLVQMLTPLSPWVYAVAFFLAIVYFFFFLARMRQMGLEAQSRAEDSGEDGRG